ncbi:hypothetical protein K438DRAFT_2088007 [Mycena galopus ATCC 62051]|nr:hypothetical protein K438DRAFT_2088007 [Mycena galopus ATCC 62051]
MEGLQTDCIWESRYFYLTVDMVPQTFPTSATRPWYIRRMDLVIPPESDMARMSQVHASNWQLGNALRRSSPSQRVFIAGGCMPHTFSQSSSGNASRNDSHNHGPAILVLGNARNASSQYELERRKYTQDLINFDVKFFRLFSEKPLE